jgi:3-deoxy-manno-octulosonate cytidylyltransferase (CMP-KDO synthetase)
MGVESKKPAVVIVIPARYASTRLPGKILADIHGKPMIQWVYERACLARCALRVVVATDDKRIEQAVRGFGGEVVMTSPELPSGTDRVAVVADQIQGDVFVNVQGDEPLIDPRSIDAAAELVVSGRFGMATLMTPLQSEQELVDPSVVKVVADRKGRAIYFSRYPIPYSRGERPAQARDFVSRRHVGLYVFDRATLARFRSLAPSSLEQAEVLEQLRALADGIAIGVAHTEFRAVGVDTPEDLDRVRKILSLGEQNGQTT